VKGKKAYSSRGVATTPLQKRKGVFNETPPKKKKDESTRQIRKSAGEKRKGWRSRYAMRGQELGTLKDAGKRGLW